MDWKKIKKLQDNINSNRIKLRTEKNGNKRKILRLKIQIDEIKIRMERME